MFNSQMVLQNVDKAQLKLKMKKENVAGIFIAVVSIFVMLEFVHITLSRRKQSYS